MKSLSVVTVALWLLGIGGWVANIFKLVADFTTLGAIDGVEILRIIGIFLAPLGAVMGYV